MKMHKIRYILKNIYWNIYGVKIRNPKLPDKIKSILFVCKGNICRSPFAERIAAHKYNVMNQYLFCSAGIYVDIPKLPPADAIIAAKSFGVNLQDHKSRKISYSLLESSDMIIAMETWQYMFLRKMFKKIRDKIFLLPLLENINRNSENKYNIYNIKDPYGRSLEEFIECYKRIESCLEGLFYNIRKD